MFTYMLTVVAGGVGIFSFVYDTKAEAVAHINALRSTRMASPWQAVIQLVNEYEERVNGCSFKFNADVTRA